MSKAAGVNDHGVDLARGRGGDVEGVLAEAGMVKGFVNDVHGGSRVGHPGEIPAHECGRGSYVRDGLAPGADPLLLEVGSYREVESGLEDIHGIRSQLIEEPATRWKILDSLHGDEESTFNLQADSFGHGAVDPRRHGFAIGELWIGFLGACNFERSGRDERVGKSGRIFGRSLGGGAHKNCPE